METAQTNLQSYLVTEKVSGLKKYISFTLGKSSIGFLVRYELLTGVLGSLPGALGLFLRSKLYPFLFKTIGKNVIFGRNVTIRHPHRMSIGNNVIIDDNCTLDARGENGKGIIIGNGVVIGRNSTFSMKDGTIELGDNTNIGINCSLQTSTNLRLGKNIIVAAYTYLVAGGNHKFERTDIPIIAQGMERKGGIVIEDNCWLGARVTILDGVTIAKESIIGAGALVNKNIPEFSIAVGTPAKVVKNRIKH